MSLRLSIRTLGLALLSPIPIMVLTATAMISCKQRSLGGSRTGFILGPVSQIHPASKASVPEFNHGVLAASALVVTQISASELKYCSGTLIAPEQAGEFGRILTNHHCFAEEDSQGVTTAVLVPQACASTKVYFGFIKGQTESATVSHCRVGTLRTSFDGDIAVFKLDTALPPTYSPLALAADDLKPDGRDALIVHYPAIADQMAVPPGGGPKVPTAAVTASNCRVVSAFPIGQWEFDRTLPYGLKHTCDIIHGSSGSGLIDARTNQLLGVDWGGLKINNDGGVETINVATRVSYVRAFLTYKTEQVAATTASILAQNQVQAKPGSSFGERTQQVVASAGKGCGIVAASGTVPANTWFWVFLFGLPLLLVLRSPRQVPWCLSTLLCLSMLLLGAAPPSLSTAAPNAVTQTHQTLVPSPLSPAAAWATSYLLSTAFIVEYLSVDALQPQAIAATGLWSAPWLRAYFAAASLRAKGQNGGFAATLAPRLQAHFDAVAAPKLAMAAAGDRYSEGQNQVQLQAGLALIAASFSPAAAGRWQHLAEAFVLSPPTCPIDYAAVKDYAAHQLRLQAGGSGRGANQAALLGPLKSWSEAKVQCLVFALMDGVADRLDQGFDPLPLLTTLTAAGAPMSHDISMRALAATRLLQLGQYPETLRILLDLVDLDDAYRLPYELVQRAFSLRQKGGGSVALQGI